MVSPIAPIFEIDEPRPRANGADLRRSFARQAGATAVVVVVEKARSASFAAQGMERREACFVGQDRISEDNERSGSNGAQ